MSDKNETAKVRKESKDKKEKQKENGSTNKTKDMEEFVDELSDSEDEEQLADKVGFVGLAKGKKEKFNTIYAILHGGSLFWYKDSRDLKPAAPGIVLSSYKLVKNPEGMKKEFCLGLESEKSNIYLAFSTNLDFEGWHKALEDNKSLPESKPPERTTESVGEKKKQGVFGRAKKKMAGDIATSGLGKRVVKAILNEETTTLLGAMKKIVTKEHDKKRADELEKSIIKITVKAYLLIENDKIDQDAFLKADKPLRQAFELMIKCFNGRGRVSQEQIEGALIKCEGFLKVAETIITDLLQPHLSPKNMFRLAQTFGYLGSAKFLNRAFDDDALERELEKLIDAMEYYTQFHYF